MKVDSIEKFSQIIIIINTGRLMHVFHNICNKSNTPKIEF